MYACTSWLADHTGYGRDDLDGQLLHHALWTGTRGGPFQLLSRPVLSCPVCYIVLSCLVLTASAIKLSPQEDQLLSKTITAEQPELEKRKSEI
eukprot:COSAG06_NODE_32729_length_501_cov_0.940299_2_plen_92_part_01